MGPLFLDTKDRDLGEGMRRDKPHDATDLRVAAPAVNMHRHRGLHLHGFSRQQLRHNLQVVRVADR
ncbi:hypothetical protein D3C71_1746980 [compost metagenome]